MIVEDNSKKIELKAKTLQGIDRSLIDFNILGSNQVMTTTVGLPLYKENGKAYIGILDRLSEGEVFQTGNLGIKYKVLCEGIKKLPKKGGTLYRVARLDCANITQTDIDAISKGYKVKLLSRRSHEDLFLDAAQIMGHDISEAESCEPDLSDTIFDCTPKAGPSTDICFSYEVSIIVGFEGTYFTYKNCDGQVETVNLVGVRPGVPHKIIIESIKDNHEVTLGDENLATILSIEPIT